MKPIPACAAVIQKDGKFLITKRLAASPMGHCWEFPGGKLEPGETVEEAVVREVREEVGLEVKVIRRLQDLHYDYPHGLIHLTFVLCSLVSGEPQTIECADFRWIEAHEFSKFEFPAADVGVIKELLNGAI